MSSTDRKVESLARALDEHSAEGIAILSSEPSRLIRATIYLLSGLLFVGLLWSFIGQANVIVKANGKLAPESDVRRVYAPIDGELVDVYIAEGMPVSKGDVLARVNALGAIEAANRALDAEMKLIDAEAKYKRFPAEKKALQDKMELIKFQIEAEEKMHQKRMAEDIAKLSEEYKLKLEKAKAKLEKAARERDQSRRIWEQHQRLFNSPGGGGISKDKVEEKKQDYHAKVTEHKLAEAALGEFEIELNKDYLKKKEEMQKTSENLANLYVQYQETAVRLEQSEKQVETELRLTRATAEGAARISFEDIDENNFLRIRAPVSGIMTDAIVTQPGDKVEPKKPLAGIAPKDARKILELEILEQDRGFLTIGMPVKVKFNAFPYQRYGIINGILEYISPTTTINPETKQQVYKGRVDLERDHFSVANAVFPLRYGMSAVAEIVVRKRRLVDMALDPFRRVIE